MGGVWGASGLGAVGAVSVALLIAAAAGERQQTAHTAQPLQGPVGFERLLRADSEPANWLTCSGQYNGQRFSRLAALTPRNAGRLQIAWIHQLRSTGAVETTPLVVDGVMYLTNANEVLALEAATGRPCWTYSHPLPSGLSLCCGRQNRGLAILNGRLYLATLDAKLIALDAATGMRLWTAHLADPAEGYSGTGAPLVVKDKVITGIAGGEFGAASSTGTTLSLALGCGDLRPFRRPACLATRRGRAIHGPMEARPSG